MPLTEFLRRSVLSASAVCLAGGVSAEGATATPEIGEPLSAIEWLSDSIDLPEEIVRPEEPGVHLPPDVVTAPLDGHDLPDRAGLIDPAETGLPSDLWGRSGATDLARAVSAAPSGGVPALRRFLRDLLVTRLDPPVDAAADDSLFLARIDKLLDLGRLDDARRLIELAGAPEPKSFRRAFDIALLKGTETEACRVIEETPDISPTYPARIFCLARNGEWEVAALTLGTAEALGMLSESEDSLLLHFLDPDLFEGEPLPPRPPVPTPLEFRLYEAMGERFPTEPLPIAFAATELGPDSGWKARLKAAERLTAAGVMPAEEFLAVLNERAPAASGGIWDRARAIKRLVDALDRGEAPAVETALPPAWVAMKESGVHAEMAGWIAARLASEDLSGRAAHAAFEIALYAGDTSLARRMSGDSDHDRFLLAIAEGRGSATPLRDPLAQAVLRGLSTRQVAERFERLLEDDRAGEALLQAVNLAAEGAEGDPDAVAEALALFRHLGLADLARQTGVELLLAEVSA